MNNILSTQEIDRLAQECSDRSGIDKESVRKTITELLKENYIIPKDDSLGRPMTNAEEELLKYYHGATTCHAYDENGRLYGTMILKVEYNCFSNSTDIIASDIKKTCETDDEYYYMN